MSDQCSPTASSPAKSAPNEKNSVNACLSCRKVKMKCHVTKGNSICDRCIRKKFHCIFEKHRRGRRPAIRPGQTSFHSAAERRPARTEGTVPEHGTLISVDPASAEQAEECPRVTQERPPSNFWHLLEGFRPSGLLNKQAMTGKLSLENITHGHNHAESVPRGDDPQQIPADDPIRLGIVNSTIAASLFSSFMRDLNPYICQFDPALHTFGYVQRKSPFLLSAILSASAKAFNPAVHSGLQTHTENMFAKCLRRGKKSTEIIEAILLLTYWKEPDDTRAWLSIGYVIRMCIELGWHKMTPKSQKDYSKMTDLQRRENRSIERTWLLLFVYDRSLSLQTGSPSMIPRNDLIESAHTWYDDPFGTPQDRLLCALVTLRMIGSEVFDLLNPHRSSNRSTFLDRTDGLMNVLLNDIQKWHDRWSNLPEMANNDLYQFFVAFYGTNLRLLFSLFPLHATLTSGLPEEMLDKQSLLISFSSAVEMLRLLVQPAFSPLVYFIQDSVQIMTAFTAIFLVKLLLSVPQGVRSEMEKPAIDAIRKASDMFSNHAAPVNSGCDLQARFLQNVLLVYRKAHELRPARGGQAVNQGNSASQRHHYEQSGGSATNTNVNTDGDMSLQRGVLPETAYAMQQSSQGGGVGGSVEEPFDYSFGLQDFAFADDDLWSNLFADAGFNITDGVFLPCGNNDPASIGPST